MGTTTHQSWSNHHPMVQFFSSTRPSADLEVWDQKLLGSHRGLVRRTQHHRRLALGAGAHWQPPSAKKLDPEFVANTSTEIFFPPICFLRIPSIRQIFPLSKTSTYAKKQNDHRSLCEIQGKPPKMERVFFIERGSPPLSNSKHPTPATSRTKKLLGLWLSVERKRWTPMRLLAWKERLITYMQTSGSWSSLKRLTRWQ